MLRERKGFNNYPDPLSSDTARKPTPPQTNEITIRFVGDMEQNIAEVVRGVRCGQAVKEEFSSILRIFAGKISRLREERDFYRQLLCLSEERQGSEEARLRAQVAALQQQLEQYRLTKDNCERCTCFDESEFRTSKFTEHPDGALSRATLRSFAQHPQEEEILIDSSKLSKQPPQDSLQVSEEESSRAASISEEELSRLMMKYNIGAQQLQAILEEYDRQNRQALEMFDSERQRQLYRLGQRMQKDLWNKKIIKDIKKISDHKR